MAENPLEQIREHSKSIDSNGNSDVESSSVFKEVIPAPEDNLNKEASLEQLASESIQPRASGELETTGLSFLFALRGGGTIAPWWTPRRDKDLRAFVIASDHLKGATYNFIARVSSIPFTIVPENKSIASQVREAKKWQQKLERTPELFGGYRKLIQKVLADYLETDNGMFFEIVAPGAIDTQIVGEVTTVNHLDSTRCIRTNNPEFPVLYEPPRGGRFKMHFSRVAFVSQLPSADEDMNGVGVCAVSRCLDAAQNLLDMDIYRQEKLGSRPGRAVIVASGGLSPKVVGSAIEASISASDNRGLTRYSMMPIVGSTNLPEGALSIVDLASIPDGFNLKDSTEIGMAIMALAFGVDVRDLFPVSGAGATRADALIQHVKQRGKGFADAIRSLEHIFDNFVLPPFLSIVYDFQDDAQDRQQAEIQNKRSMTRKNDLETTVTTIRVERERMVARGEISEDDFIEMELQDGRLPNGLPVITLFTTTDKAIAAMLLIPGVENPLDTTVNAPEMIIPLIDKQEAKILAILGTSNSRDLLKAREALAALQALRREYEFIGEETILSTSGAMNEDIDELTLLDDEEQLMDNELDTGSDTNDEKALALITGDESMDVKRLLSLLSARDKKKLSKQLLAAQSAPSEYSILEAVQGIIASIPDKPPVSMNFDLGKSFGDMVTNTVSATIKEVLQNMPMPLQPIVEVNVPEQLPQEIVIQMPDSNKSVALELPPQFIEQLQTLVKQQSEPVINITMPEQPAPTVNVNVPEGAIQLQLPEQETVEIKRNIEGDIIEMTKRRIVS